MKVDKSNGFTILEVLIAIAIVAIVASIAISSYQTQTLKSKRAEAKAELSKISMAQERFFSNNNTYTTDLSELLGYTTAAVTTDNGLYEIVSTASAGGNIATSFILTAKPLGNQLKDDCETLTLDSVGVKNFTLKLGANLAIRCW